MATTNPTTQRRLTALVVGAIYAIVDALFPIIKTIAHDTGRSWNQRASYTARLTRILQELLALTARIRPTSLSRNPTFNSVPNQTAQPAAATTPKQPAPIRPLPPIGPARPLSARQFAKRLQHLLRQLEKLAAEIGTALPAIIHRNIERARAMTGCDTLPPTKTWERAG